GTLQDHECGHSGVVPGNPNGFQQVRRRRNALSRFTIRSFHPLGLSPILHKTALLRNSRSGLTLKIHGCAMSETEHHLEHAEHAQHAAHSPFDRRVTMTIAIIAALLACVTLLSHRAHNETLALEIEAGQFSTSATDKWNQYQAKKIRQY